MLLFWTFFLILDRDDYYRTSYSLSEPLSKVTMAPSTSLLNEDRDDEDYTDDLELADGELEKLPESSFLPKWYQLPSWQTSVSRWDFSSRWYTWSTKTDVSEAKAIASRILPYIIAALPCFFQPGGLKTPKKLHPTAYLDALRGWAALLVFRYHVFRNRTWLLEQYVFRGFLNGRAMVEVFFVISGYVLSYRLLKLIRNQHPGISRAVASSTFRRWFRLFIPTGISTLVVSVLSHFDWCRSDLRQESLPAQLRDWFGDFLWTSNPFADVQGWWYGDVFRTKYLDVMWTIPVEFRGSIVLFMFCAVAAQLSTRSRRICCAIIILLCYYWGTLYAALFLIGMFIADLQFDRHPERLLGPKPLPQQHHHAEIITSVRQNDTQQQSAARKVICGLLVLISLLLFSQPEEGFSLESPFPFDRLSLATPTWYPGSLSEYFWLSIGATLLVLAIDNCRMLQLPFEWPFSQYLGDLSFGIYALHYIVMWVFYWPYVEPFREAHFGEGYWSGLPGMIVTTVVVLWCADWFSRVDYWVVWFGKWLETKAFIKEDGS